VLSLQAYGPTGPAFEKPRKRSCFRYPQCAKRVEEAEKELQKIYGLERE
jgi:hypothetical protein